MTGITILTLLLSQISHMILPGVIGVQREARQNKDSVVRLLRLEGSFATEEPVKSISGNRPEAAGFILSDVRLEGDSMGFLTRIRSVLTIANLESSRRISQVEWRLDIYDAVVRSHSQDVLQSEKVNIYPGETANASSKFGAVLPDKLIVFFRLVRVSFADGSSWMPAAECTLGDDLRSITCTPK